MAEVQLALQRGPAGFEKLVVVKLVHENLASQKAFVDMLLDEARVAALVKHPNVVDIYDLGEVEGRYFIAMEYLEGEPLLAVLRAGRDGRRLDTLSTARLIADTAEGLDAAHELRSMAGDPIELVHHDISLGNIMVLYNGQVKLVDFGVAKATQSATPHTKIQGKFSYMAPEKLRGAPGDRRSDIWSLGCVLWEALALKRLFRGGNETETMQQVLELPIAPPSRVNGDVAPDFDAIVLRSLERDPDRRYPTAKAMAAELEEVLRKHGYAAKNDVIAKYMQATFHSHIAARKKLLQEVSSKGRASADVLEAAFHTGAMAAGTPIVPGGELSSLRYLPADPSVEQPGTLDPASRRGVGVDGDRTVVEPPRIGRRRWLPMAAVTGAIVVVAVAGTVAAMRGESAPERPVAADAMVAAVAKPVSPPSEPGTAAVTAPPASAEPATGTTPPAAVVRTASSVTPVAPAAPAAPASTAPASTAPATPTAAAGPAREPSTRQLSTRPTGRRTAAVRTTSPARPPSDKVGPEELVRTGLQAWVVHRDSKSALASFRRALEANAAYGPAWRCIGLVSEKLGDKATARNAFQRYLALSPRASDAAEIRAKLESP
jgi:eukaryotic-like serine/threonine-protein kinase